MRLFTKLFAAIAALFASASFVSCQDVIITADKLPAAAQTFIKEYFPGSDISYAKKDKELTKTTYEVVLQDGTEIDFDSKGQWDKVDCKRFPGQAIVKIDKELFGYEIELLNDLELKFDKNGRLVNIDD